jgi:hypothetical protein
MKNYYELLNMVKNEVSIDTIKELQEDFNKDFRKELEKIQINNSTRIKAIKNYVNNDMTSKDDSHPGTQVFCNGYSILNTTIKEELNCSKKNNTLSDYIVKALKNKKPVEKYLRDSIAIARALGWKPGTKKYIFNIDDNYIFDFSLVYEVFSCIADSKNIYGGAECFLCDMENTNKKALVLISKYGIGYILPLNVASFNNNYNVDFNYYIEHEKKIEKLLIDKALKTA